MLNQPVVYSKKDHIGLITLNRPEMGNVIDLPMAQELMEICEQVSHDEDINIVVVTGAGGVFCCGGDTQALAKQIDDQELVSKYSPVEAIAAIECPTLAALNGDAMGEGLELALACDLRISSDKARFGLPQVSEGLIPMDGGTQRLSRIVGKAKALELVLTGEVIDAKAAFEIGLVNKVVEYSNFVAEVENIAKTIGAKAPISLRYAKEAVNKGLDLTLEQGLRLEADLYFLIHTTADRKEGVKSFLEKRQPKFKGR